MTEQPSGLLHWGQAGTYDAIDDRLVVTTLAAGTIGLVRPPTLTPGAGLTVNIGRWHGTVDCEDGTLAVIGSRDQQPIDVPAGGATTRTDWLWADIDPDMGSWSIDLYSPEDAAGRSGLKLGEITVPAGANSATSMDMRPASVALARVRANYSTAPRTVSGQGGQTLAELPPLPIQAGRRYYLRFHGWVTGLAATPGYLVLAGAGGLAVPNNEMRAIITWLGQGNTPTIKVQPNLANTNMQSGNLVNGALYDVSIEGYIQTVSTDGDLVISLAAQAATGNIFRVEPGCTLLIVDITTGAPGVYVGGGARR